MQNRIEVEHFYCADSRLPGTFVAQSADGGMLVTFKRGTYACIPDRSGHVVRVTRFMLRRRRLLTQGVLSLRLNLEQ
ncbi:hypothetical protein Ga0074115_10339 [endosymbiont of Ridgeia piscesae]|jgi:hypothetical protein|uniref:Uncharacterized protein n=1 Tax=endosymbiont of Ridgeia piscesae TaxID=54398 RepID=A0A0T5Z8I0_9GAMM|nr:hypothetical protein Ga0074115_10339 [endosymbiont of Ridgeia piscesae]KRT59207.1 hypothetical protein Ga0076813_15023 [endosymbiont of Ridgeia piscesae]